MSCNLSRFRSNFCSLALIAAVALSGSVIPQSALAKDRSGAEHNMPTKDKDGLRIADDGYLAIRDIRGARLAIFNGATDEALTLTQAALVNLQDAKAVSEKLSVKTTKKPPEGDTYLPFDSSLMLAEGFVPTDEKTKKIKEANGHLAKGHQAKAIETLRLAQVDMTVSAALLPVKSSLGHAMDAVELIRSGQFYQANLALKAIEDSVIIESYAIDALPEQGKQK